MTSNTDLPTIETSAVEGQQTFGDTVFPYVFVCRDEDAQLALCIEWMRSHRDDLLDLSTKHGAVLFRGFPTPSVESFDSMIQALSIHNFEYKKSLSNAVRVNRTERVFTANEAPPDIHIFFHHEMAQTPIYPERILFYCEVPAEEGGATPICRSDILYQRLSERCPDFIRKCETSGLKYTNVMPAADDLKSGMGRSWQSTLGVDTREKAEARLSDLNYSWKWLEDGCLKATTPPLPAVKEVEPGRKTFFNQLIAAYCGWSDSRNRLSEAIRHGDGALLDANAVKVAVEIANELAFDVEWQAGDFVLVDNRIAMHARRTFKGTRRIVASLAEMRTQTFELESAA